MENIVRTEKEIDMMLNRCVDNIDEGTSESPGMSYEQGIIAAYEWLTGQTNDYPFD